MAHDSGFRPEADLTRLLRNLVDAEQWERAVAVSGQILAEDPENRYALRTRALAALRLGRHRLARESCAATIAADPGDAFPHYLMAKLFEIENRPLYARKHLLTALSLEPETADYWLAYGWNCLLRGDHRSTREAADQALALAPETPESLRLLAAANSGLEDGSGTKDDAFARIGEYETALALDPDDSITHYLVGTVYLDELDDSENAERHFRSALLSDPTDKAYRTALFRTIRRRDPVLRVLYFPLRLGNRVFRYLDRLARTRPSCLILLLPLLVLLAPLPLQIAMFWAIFLLAPAKIYEFLTLAHTRRNAGEVLRPGGKVGIVHSLPLIVLFGFFVLLFLGFVAAVGWLLFNPTIRPRLGEILSGLFLVFLVVAFWFSAKNPHKER